MGDNKISREIIIIVGKKNPTHPRSHPSYSRETNSQRPEWCILERGDFMEK